jgi:hypothetical protein
MKGIASTGAPKTLLDGWMGGWMDGWESRVKDCLQQSKNERLKKNMKTFVYFLKYSHYDAKFAAAKFDEECEIRIRINFKNAKICKHSFRIQKAKFAHAWINISFNHHVHLIRAQK